MNIYDNLPKDLQYIINDYLLPKNEMDQVMSIITIKNLDYQFSNINGPRKKKKWKKKYNFVKKKMSVHRQKARTHIELIYNVIPYN